MAKQTPLRNLSRREFLLRAAAISGAAAVAAALEGCSIKDLDVPVTMAPTGVSPATAPASATAPAAADVNEMQSPTGTAVAPTATQTEEAEDGVARVAFVKTDNRAEGVRRAIELLGFNPVDGKTVLIKPNFNSYDPTPGSTHPELLAALVSALQGMGAQKISVGDRSGMGDTRLVFERLGIFSLADQLGFDTVIFEELAAEDWVKFEPAGMHWQRGFALPRPALDAGVLVQTCCLKTHRFGGHFTLSLKNSVGLAAKRIPQEGYDYMQELHSSPDQRRMIAEINSAYSPALIVLDGVEGFISGGPDVGEKVASEVILAGTDRIAIDAVGVALLRFHGCQTEAAGGKIFDQEQIARAVELGLGIDSPERIEFLTGDGDSEIYSEQIREILSVG